MTEYNHYFLNFIAYLQAIILFFLWWREHRECKRLRYELMNEANRADLWKRMCEAFVGGHKDRVDMYERIEGELVEKVKRDKNDQ